MWRRAAVILGTCLALAVLGAFGPQGPSPAPLPVITQADDPTQPYYIVAIDYHFHNAHPTIPLGVDREVIFESDAMNLHNVTIPSIGYSKDLRVGGQIVIPHIGSLLSQPGRYTFYCKYHVDRGMAGVIVISG
jgi:hypothetical protein